MILRPEPMTPGSTSRSASLAITLLGTTAHAALAIQVITAWRNIKWVTESEWEGLRRVDGVKLFWSLLSVYFAAASAVSFVGFLGVIKNKPSYVRFYRDSSIADFVFTAFATIIGAYSAFQPAVRTAVCEELSRQPEFMRDMVEMGLNLENCELWFERAVLVTLTVAVVLVGIRLHFLLTVSRYYYYLTRHHRVVYLSPHSPSNNADSHSLQRIYLLPSPLSTSTSSSPPRPNSPTNPVVYAPVTLNSLSPDVARDLRATATTAWISHTAPDSKSHTHSHRHRFHSTSAGKISLPVGPDEGLLLAEDKLLEV